MLKTLIIIIQVTFLSLQLWGQSNSTSDNQVCLDSLTTRYLTLRPWYNVTPNFLTEQVRKVEYYINEISDLKDTNVYLGKLTFKPDGTYLQTYKSEDTTIVKNGTWSVSPIERTIDLTFTYIYKEKEYKRTWSWFIFDLTSTRMIMQVSKIY